MNLEIISSNKSFGGWHKRYRHHASVLGCEMNFAIYLPPQALTGQKVPVLYWLSGLTCTDENFMQKAGAQRIAADLGIALVAPDTSPRGDGVADDPGYDLGMGAGFYVNASQSPWQAHYQMYDYVTRELPDLIETHFPVSTRRAISGHSMGGHGALIAALREPGRYRSVSAFSPICHPSRCPWGQKALGAYLGSNPLLWQEWDACQGWMIPSSPSSCTSMRWPRWPPARSGRWSSTTTRAMTTATTSWRALSRRTCAFTPATSDQHRPVTGLFQLW